jgi:uncharacterized membrane protein
MSRKRLSRIAMVCGGIAAWIIGVWLLSSQVDHQQKFSLAWLIWLVISSAFIGFGSSTAWAGLKRTKKSKV